MKNDSHGTVWQRFTRESDARIENIVTYVRREQNSGNVVFECSALELFTRPRREVVQILSGSVAKIIRANYRVAGAKQLNASKYCSALRVNQTATSWHGHSDSLNLLQALRRCNHDLDFDIKRRHHGEYAIGTIILLLECGREALTDNISDRCAESIIDAWSCAVNSVDDLLADYAEVRDSK